MMIKRNLFLIFSILVCGYSCNSNTDATVNNTEGNKIIQETLVDCDSLKIIDFKSFLHFNYGDSEQLLTARLGQMSTGNYSEDSTIFIYNYKRAPRVPIQVWTNLTTNKVTTIFMEVLSLDELFEADLDKAVVEYNISECDRSWFGKSAAEIKKQLGEPTHDVVNKDFVNEISYLSEYGNIMVAFKIYPEQKDKCSSVAVTWFYE